MFVKKKVKWRETAQKESELGQPAPWPCVINRQRVSLQTPLPACTIGSIQRVNQKIAELSLSPKPLANSLVSYGC